MEISQSYCYFYMYNAIIKIVNFYFVLVYFHIYFSKVGKLHSHCFVSHGFCPWPWSECTSIWVSYCLAIQLPDLDRKMFEIRLVKTENMLTCFLKMKIIVYCWKHQFITSSSI